MEALTAVSTAALTVYDMCKAVQKDMVITDIRLLSKKAFQENILAVVDAVDHGLEILASAGSANCGG